MTTVPCVSDSVMEVLVVGESDHLQIGAGSGEICGEGDDNADDNSDLAVLWVKCSRLQPGLHI